MKTNNNVILIQAISENQNNYVPLGLAYLGAVFEKNNCNVKIIDATAPYADYSTNDIVTEVEEFNPAIVGITLTTTYSNYSYELMKRFSKKRNFLLIVGGPHASILPEEVLGYGADIIVRGEGEETCVDILNYLDGKIKLEDILGISYKKEDGKISHNPSRPFIPNLDSLPFPAKHLFKKEDYIQNQADIIRFSNVIGTRGCVGQCSYCANNSMWGRKVRTRSAENIISEVEILIKNYGLNKIQFLDDGFTTYKKNIHDLCDRITHKQLNIEWNIVTRIDLVDFELLKKMKEAGCSNINYGVESGDLETLKKINKFVYPDRVEKTIQWTNDVGINIGVNFMCGFPWDTVESLRNTANFIKKLKGSVRHIMPGGILVPHPGTQIYNEYKNNYNYENWWLKKKLLTTKEIKVSPPLFVKLFFNSDSLNENYFNYSKEVTKEIEKIAGIIGRHNLLWFSKEISGIPIFYYFIREILYMLVLISRGLYKISPPLEQKLMGFFLRLATKAEANLRVKKGKAEKERI